MLELTSKRSAVKKGLESLLEVQPDTPENKAVKNRLRFLVSFVEELQAHPELLLTQPAAHISEKGVVFPDWIHQRFSKSGTPEEIARDSSLRLFQDVWLINHITLNKEDLFNIFTLKNTLLRRIQERIERNSEHTKKEFLQSMDFFSLLYEALTEQAVFNYSLEKAQRNIQESAPVLALEQPVAVFASPLKIRLNGATYLGKTKDQHYIVSDLSTISLTALHTEDAPFLLKDLISTMEHELIHAKQAELVENQSIVSGGQINPMNRMTQSRLEVLSQQTALGRDADDMSLILELNEQEKAFRRSHIHSFELYRALAEGPAIYGEFFLLSRKILQERNPVKKRELETFMRKSLEHLRSQEMKKSCPFYADGRRIYNKLQVEFGLHKFPEIFRHIDFSNILQLKATSELMNKLMEDPRIIPGLSKIPEIKESLQKRPSNVSL